MSAPVLTITTVDVAYRYPTASTLRSAGHAAELLLATSGGVTEAGPALHPYFFRGFLTEPGPAAQALLACAAVARANYAGLSASQIAARSRCRPRSPAWPRPAMAPSWPKPPAASSASRTPASLPDASDRRYVCIFRRYGTANCKRIHLESADRGAAGLGMVTGGTDGRQDEH